MKTDPIGCLCPTCCDVRHWIRFSEWRLCPCNVKLGNQGNTMDETDSHDQFAHKIGCLYISLLFYIAHSNLQLAQPKIKSNWVSGRLAISCTWNKTQIFAFKENINFSSECHFTKNMLLIIPPAQRSCCGVYWFHSIRPSRILCPLCSAYSFGWINFIFICLIKQLQKVFCV